MQQNWHFFQRNICFFTWDTWLRSVFILQWHKDTYEVCTHILIQLSDIVHLICTIRGLGLPWDNSISPYLGGPPNVPTWFLSNGNPTLSLLPWSPLCNRGAPGFGLLMTPMKIGTCVISSIRAKKKGWIRWKTGLDAREMTTLVAAAASAPSSFISMLDLCSTLDTRRGPSEISAKFGLENISPSPNTEQRGQGQFERVYNFYQVITVFMWWKEHAENN